MHTRKDYLAGKVTHSDYYAQFATDSHKYYVLREIGMSRLKAATSPNFNEIPLVEWDFISFSSSTFSSDLIDKLKACGDYLTKSGRVCILKEAARQLVAAEKSGNLLYDTIDNARKALERQINDRNEIS